MGNPQSSNLQLHIKIRLFKFTSLYYVEAPHDGEKLRKETNVQTGADKC